MTGTDRCYSMLSKNITLEENLRENPQKNYIYGMV